MNIYTSGYSLFIIKQSSANYRPQISSSPSLFLQIKFYWNTVIFIHLHTLSIPFTLQWQNWGVVTDTIWSAKPKTLTIFLFTEKTCQPLLETIIKFLPLKVLFHKIHHIYHLYYWNFKFEFYIGITAYEWCSD